MEHGGYGITERWRTQNGETLRALTARPKCFLSISTLFVRGVLALTIDYKNLEYRAFIIDHSSWWVLGEYY